jgi:hypothetical protein
MRLGYALIVSALALARPDLPDPILRIGSQQGVGASSDLGENRDVGNREEPLGSDRQGDTG